MSITPPVPACNSTSTSNGTSNGASDSTSNGASDSASDPRAAALRAAHQQKLTKFFLTFAIAEGCALVVAIIIMFVLLGMPREQAVWGLIAIAVIGGSVLSVQVMLRTRTLQDQLNALSSAPIK